MADKTARQMHELMRLEKMMTDAYDTALRKVHDEDLREPMQRFRQQHSECAQTLESLGQQGQTPGQAGEWFGRYLDAVTESLDRASRRDDVLSSLRIAEAGLGWQYAYALEDNSEGEEASTLKKGIEAQQEHMGFLSLAEQVAKV